MMETRTRYVRLDGLPIVLKRNAGPPPRIIDATARPTVGPITRQQQQPPPTRRPVYSPSQQVPMQPTATAQIPPRPSARSSQHHQAPVEAQQPQPQQQQAKTRQPIPLPDVAHTTAAHPPAPASTPCSGQCPAVHDLTRRLDQILELASKIARAQKLEPDLQQPLQNEPQPETRDRFAPREYTTFQQRQQSGYVSHADPDFEQLSRSSPRMWTRTQPQHAPLHEPQPEMQHRITPRAYAKFQQRHQSGYVPLVDPEPELPSRPSPRMWTRTQPQQHLPTCGSQVDPQAQEILQRPLPRVWHSSQPQQQTYFESHVGSKNQFTNRDWHEPSAQNQADYPAQQVHRYQSPAWSKPQPTIYHDPKLTSNHDILLEPSNWSQTHLRAKANLQSHQQQPQSWCHITQQRQQPLYQTPPIEPYDDRLADISISGQNYLLNNGIPFKK